MGSTTTSGTSTLVQDPLTTIFTPASWCSTRPYTSTESDGTTWYQRDLALVELSGYGPLGRTSSCYAPSVPFHRRPNVGGVFSPGVCPQGSTIASSIVTGSPPVTKAQCCPIGMDIDHALPYGMCTRLVTTPTTVALHSGDFSSIKTDFTAADVWLAIAWASSDLNNFTPKSAPILARMTETALSSSSSAAATGAKPGGPSKTGHAEHKSSGGDLSTGADAGIAVGTAIVVLVVVGLLVWFCLRRRKRRQQRGVAGVGLSAADTTPLPPYSSSRVQSGSYQKIDPWSGGAPADSVAPMRLELHSYGAQPPRHELTSNAQIYEMEDRSRTRQGI